MVSDALAKRLERRVGRPRVRADGCWVHLASWQSGRVLKTLHKSTQKIILGTGYVVIIITNALISVSLFLRLHITLDAVMSESDCHCLARDASIQSNHITF